jgi:diguanylate cyclase (GGDEF)-like protein
MARRDRLTGYLNSLTGRMALGLIAIHAVLIPLLFGGVLYIVKQGYQDQFVQYVRSDEAAIAHLAALDPARERLQALLDETTVSGRVTSAEVLDGAGRSLARAGVPPPVPFTEDFFFGQHEDNVYLVSLPLEGTTRSLRLGYDESLTAEQIALAYRRGLYVAIAYIVLTLALATVIGPRLARPLRQLREASCRIAYGQFGVDLRVASTLTEIRDLADDLDFMRVELAKQSARLEHQALHDALTGLPNRVLLQDRTQHAMRVGRRVRQHLSLILLDLDHFKEVNDTLGHAAGDVILREVAERLRQVARESDTVSRLGGDEFALLLLTAEAAHVSGVADKIVETLRRPFVVENQTLHVGTSIGIAMYPEHGGDFDALLRKADIALYESKRTRGSHTVYRPELDSHNPSRLTLSAELRHAIERGELVLHYQPKIHARSREVHGVEALVRWQHPRRGLVPPDEFIPLAEKTGLIRPLTLWTLDAALRQCRAWHDRGVHLNVAVNLSALCLDDVWLTDAVGAALQHHGVKTSRLELELTESAVMADPSRARQIFTALDALGTGLSIDDFGTGYSSLTHLRRLPVTEIKIDKSFVVDLPTDASNGAIAHALIRLAHSLGIGVVAEGVEQELAFRLLRRMDCDLVQGFHLCRPLPAADFDRWHDEYSGNRQTVVAEQRATPG